MYLLRWNVGSSEHSGDMVFDAMYNEGIANEV